MPQGRSPKRGRADAADRDRDYKHHRRLRDALPLEIPSSIPRAELDDAKHVSSRKPETTGERNRHTDLVSVPRSRSYHQHDDRGKAAQDGRRSGRRSTPERGWWKDSRDGGQATHKTAGSDVQDKEGKSRGVDNNVVRQDRYSEVVGGADPPAKKRRPFREEKLPPEPEPVERVQSVPKSAHPISSDVGGERREERARDRRPLERREHDGVHERERSFPNRGQAEKSRFDARGRFSGGNHGGRFEGRDRFGGRLGYLASGGRVEKWKLDLFDETNRSPSPKGEEDPVAKVEALLSL